MYALITIQFKSMQEHAVKIDNNIIIKQNMMSVLLWKFTCNKTVSFFSLNMVMQSGPRLPQPPLAFS